jgi:hypothetical protein
MLEKVAGSVGGILRGYMALKVSNTIRRTSPLFVSDAMSDEAVLQKDFNLTSKNTEEEDGATSKIFTSDTAPYRKQSYSIGLNIKNLRFLRQDRVWTNSVSPDDKSEKLWVEELRNTFKKLGCSDDVEIKNNYIDSNDICHSATRGIHLSNEQTRAVVKATLVKSLSVNAMKAKASIETDPSSIEALVTFEDGSTRKYSSLDELLSDIDKAEFQDFYYEGAEGMTLPERDELRAKLEGRAQAKKEQKSKEKEEKKAAKQQKAA